MNIANRPAILIVLVLMVCTATTAHTESEGEMIPVGKPFADFNLPAHDGSIVRSEDLAGQPFLLFFYPKADTPG
jgi:cytochrome oxidase Cu insertion factor (SCO1/SenC/PrrC family)